MMPVRGYLLCGIPRTGTSLLGQALAGTGVAGLPREYFNPALQSQGWVREILGESDLVGGLHKILCAGTTPNGLFGAKVHGSHLRHLGIRIQTGRWADRQTANFVEVLRLRLPQLLSETDAREYLRSVAPGPLPHITAYLFLKSALPELRVVWIRRRNMIARAISEFRALKTGVWLQPMSKDIVASVEMPEFDFAEIHNLHCVGSFHDELLQQLFQEQQIAPHCVFYEDLASDYDSSVRGVLEFLDIDSRKSVIPPPGIRKQSDELSAEWEVWYRLQRDERWV